MNFETQDTQPTVNLFESKLKKTNEKFIYNQPISLINYFHIM